MISRGSDRGTDLVATNRRTTSVFAGLLIVLGALPVFIIGAMGAELRTEFGVGPAVLGVAFLAFRVTSGIVLPFAGSLVDRLGARAAIRLTAVVAAIASVGIGSFARTVAGLIAWLVVAGLANALAHPAANKLLVDAVQRDRLGRAFGIKQSAPPLAALLAGFSLPAIGLTVGWRWAYALVIVIAGMALLLASRYAPKGEVPTTALEATMTAPVSSTPNPSLPRTSVVAGASSAVGFALGAAASTSVSAFYVDAAVHSHGIRPTLAGITLGVASLAAILVRLGLGPVADRLVDGHLRVCAILVAIGALGLLGLAVGSPAVAGSSAIVGLAGSWGFNGVFWYSTIRDAPEAAGRRTGLLLPAGLAGGSLGPLAFGFLVDAGGYRVAWLAAAATSTAAAATFAYADLLRRRSAREGRRGPV